MRNQRLTLTFIALASLAAFFACNKYTDTTSNSTTLPQDQLVTASLQGRVLDENGLPVEGAAVSSGTATATTDVNGIFNFTDIQLSSRFGFVKVVKTGYFMGSRSIITDAGKSSYVSIQLLPRTSKGTFAAGSGGVVVVDAGDTVSFNATSVVTAATNAAYTGNVHVFAAYINPTDKNIYDHMPGDLRGIDSSGKETLLLSYGMMVVELEGDAGEKLQIAPGKVANLSIKIPDALKASAAAAIPLWYFNDTTGKWIQQGTATKKDGQYCGQTSHFSWWNCDAPTGAVNFTVHVKDPGGNPLAYTFLQFSSPTIGARGGYTDINGYASGLIPKGQSMLLQVFNFCGDVVGGANVGPALADQDLGTLTVGDTTRILTLKGTVVDCSGSAVDSGYVNVQIEGRSYRTAVTKGAFSLTVQRCNSSSASITVTPGDYKALQQGSSSMLTGTYGNLDAGKLTACGTSVDAFISVTINGALYRITAPPDSVTYTNMGTYGTFWAMPHYSDNNFGTYIAWDVNNPLAGAGTFTGRYFVMNVNGKNYSSLTMQCVVSDFGAVNGYVSGSISADVSDSTTQVTYPMTGTFKAKRNN